MRNWCIREYTGGFANTLNIVGGFVNTPVQMRNLVILNLMVDLYSSSEQLDYNKTFNQDQ